MTTQVPLDNVDHADLRVALRHGADVGDAVNQVLLFPTEFEPAQREYPIVMRRDAAGNFYAVALLGFERDENLFLEGDRWAARYVPAIRQRGPFTRAAPMPGAAAEDESARPILIDLADPRVGATDGELLFLRHGGTAPYLRHIGNVLDVVDEGHTSMAPSFAALEQAGLLRPTSITAEIADGKSVVIEDVHVVTADAIAALDGAVLEGLARRGMLHAACMAAASLDNMGQLIARYRARHGIAT